MRASSVGVRRGLGWDEEEVEGGAARVRGKWRYVLGPERGAGS